MNKIIQGNILDIQSGIIAHQVNCKRVAGAGLALQIRRKWPDWYEDYIQKPSEMGGLGLFKISERPPLYIASIYAQKSIGTKSRHTDYPSFKIALSHLVRFIGADYQLYIPYGVGCGLGGGDWTIVSKIIEIVAPRAILVKL